MNAVGRFRALQATAQNYDNSSLTVLSIQSTPRNAPMTIVAWVRPVHKIV